MEHKIGDEGTSLLNRLEFTITIIALVPQVEVGVAAHALEGDAHVLLNNFISDPTIAPGVTVCDDVFIELRKIIEQVAHLGFQIGTIST